jgi:manganese transport protein
LGLNYLLAKKDYLFKLIAYTGPALIVSMAYMDPGNYGTDIQAGASLNYDLLWVVWLSSGMAMLLQYLSGKIGIAIRLSLSEIISEKLRKKGKTYVILYWFATEIAVAATDLAEYMGTVIALNLLFGIPMIYSAIFGAVDVILILLLATQRRFRIIERLFALFVSIIGFGYLYEIFIIKPNPSAILYHSFIPSLGSSHAILLAVGVIGATVMPHALFVHSWLTKNKAQNKTLLERRKLRKFHLIENVFLLIVAGMINSAIMIPAGSSILMSQYLMHRNPRYFPQPERFDPERWTTQEKARRPRFSYFPFGGGPRSCIGESFAWMQGILVIATIAHHWNMQHEPGHSVVLQPLVTLRPKYGMLMKVVKRKKQ